MFSIIIYERKAFVKYLFVILCIIQDIDGFSIDKTANLCKNI